MGSLGENLEREARNLKQRLGEAVDAVVRDDDPHAPDGRRGTLGGAPNVGENLRREGHNLEDRLRAGADAVVHDRPRDDRR